MARRPVLDYRQNRYFAIFQYVARSRPPSMAGVAPLPLTQVIKDYCETFYITSVDERDRISQYVAAMDDAYIEHISKKQAK